MHIISSTVKSVQMSNQTVDVSTNAIFYMNTKQLLIGVNTLTQPKHDHFSLWDIFTHHDYLQIARLMCLCVDIHVGLMFIYILIIN